MMKLYFFLNWGKEKALNKKIDYMLQLNLSNLRSESWNQPGYFFLHKTVSKQKD